MPVKAPRICPCGYRVPSGVRCKCEQAQDAERKARFDKARPTSSARGYNGSWDKAKAEYLRAHRFCVRCGAPAKLVDHIEPHKGDKGKFWDRANWQALCTPCHSGPKQREERMRGR